MSSWAVVCLLLFVSPVYSQVAFDAAEGHEVLARLPERLDREAELLNDQEELMGIAEESVPNRWPEEETVLPSSSSLRSHHGKVCSSSECQRVAEMVKSHMDMSADPCTEVDQFICGGWRDSFVLPPDETGWTISFDEIANRTRHTIRNILEEQSCEKLLEESTLGDDDFQSWKALSTCIYESCMNTDALDEFGSSPMMKLLFEGEHNVTWLVTSKFDQEQQQLPGIADRRDLFSSRMFDLANKLQDVLFWGFWVGLNTLSPEKHQTLRVHGSGLGLSYHFYDERHTDIQSNYREHLSNLFKLFEQELGKYDAGLLDSYIQDNPNRRNFTPEERAMRVYDFEASLREILLSPEESRNVVKYTNAITYGQLKESSPLLDIGRIIDYFLAKAGKQVSDEHELLIHDVEYLKKVADKLQEQDWGVLFDYILVHTISGYASMLSDPWRKEKEAYKKKRTGADPLPRWRTCRVSPPSWVVSRRYISEQYDTRRKKMTQELIRDLKKAFSKMLNDYEWMSEDTKDLAAEKLKRMSEKIAFPDWLEDDFQEYFEKYYGKAQEALEKVQTSYFGVKLHLGEMGTLYELSQFEQPQDRTEWHMNPQSVNAYYSPATNQIAFMAAILEEPSVFVWSKDGGRAEEIVMKTLTYGGIGGIIGHEITHGFDDKGKDYDADGKLHKWWSEKSEASFTEKAQCVEDQYDNFSVTLPIEGVNGEITNSTLNVRGSLTLGENIADNGGIQLSWEALKLKLTDRELEARPLSNFGVNLTTTQLFMFAWGHFWCSVNRPKSVRRRIESDPHSPDRFRTEGPLANFKLFAEVFQCPLGSPMHPEEVCRVW
eukprot:GHVS01098321.1.p1 GENE.GHVS01098321.1~~GHVS01098321.1.p1  ORF type:complete len:830 (+),score=103.40 GHVS01098321.1:291-2780(+)